MIALLVAAALLNIAILAMLTVPWHRRLLQIPSGAGEIPGGLPGISLIIAARNEAANLHRFLPSALRQAYPLPYEVIVALDRCTDDSEAVVAGLAMQFPHLRMLTIDTLPDGWTGKKNALNLAIQAAQHECLAFTDADCALPEGWLEGIGGQFAAGKELVLGVSPYARRRGLLNLVIRYETWMTALLYVGLAHWSRPYMGVGRSLAYRKAWFRSAGGFEGIAGRMSGDDDLLVNRAAESRTTGLLIPEATQVISMPETTWKAWFQQKVRHGSAGSAYKPTTLLILSGLHGVHLIFYLSLTVVLCLQTAMGWALLIYLCRAAAMGMILYSLPWKQKQGLPLASPLLDLAYLLYLVLLPVTAACIQPKWN